MDSKNESEIFARNVVLNLYEKFYYHIHTD